MQWVLSYLCKLTYPANVRLVIEIAINPVHEIQPSISPVREKHIRNFFGKEDTVLDRLFTLPTSLMTGTKV